jgi:hypothetical protein
MRLNNSSSSTGLWGTLSDRINVSRLAIRSSNMYGAPTKRKAISREIATLAGENGTGTKKYANESIID